MDSRLIFRPFHQLVIRRGVTYFDRSGVPVELERLGSKLEVVGKSAALMPLTGASELHDDPKLCEGEQIELRYQEKPRVES
jgi:hypothetical protein